jgi:hypothetical protein
MASVVENVSDTFIDRRSYDPFNPPPARERRQFSNSYEELSPEARELGTAIDQYNGDSSPTKRCWPWSSRWDITSKQQACSVCHTGRGFRPAASLTGVLYSSSAAAVHCWSISSGTPHLFTLDVS